MLQNIKTALNYSIYKKSALAHMFSPKADYIIKLRILNVKILNKTQGAVVYGLEH